MKEFNFNAKEIKDKLVAWIRDWFEVNGKDCNAIIGISGGKDSIVVAALCCEILGKARVIGIMMHNGEQKDIKDSIQVCEYLGIRNYTVNIAPMVNNILESMSASGVLISEQTRTNIPPRVRMTTLYAYSQSMKGRVIGTTNLSEFFIGYLTRYGDGGTDVEPIGNLTVREVLALGDELGLPYNLVHKTPIDGLNTNPDGSYVTDEQSIGFTYSELDDYLLLGIKPSDEKFEKIMNMHNRSLFKDTLPKRCEFK